MIGLAIALGIAAWLVFTMCREQYRAEKAKVEEEDKDKVLLGSLTNQVNVYQQLVSSMGKEMDSYRPPQYLEIDPECPLPEYDGDDNDGLGTSTTGANTTTTTANQQQQEQEELPSYDPSWSQS